MGKLSAIRTNIKTILEDIDGLTAPRIKLGYNVFVDTSDFLNDLVTSGYYVVIHDGHIHNFEVGTGLGEYEVKVTLYFGYNKDADYDFVAVEDLVEEIRDAVLDQDNWDDISNGPKEFSVEKTNLNTDNTIIAKSYDMTFLIETH